MGINEKKIAINPRLKKEQSRAFIQECPLSDYDKLTGSKPLAELARRISASTDEDEQRRLKGCLPFRCPHYTRFRDNYRDRQHIDPESFTWQTCIDIDEPELVEMANRRSKELDEQKGGRWQGLLLHKDYSARNKLHIDIRLPIGMTVAEAQRAYCNDLGVAPDTSCFTPERFIYITPAEYEIYRADGWYAPLPEEEVKTRRKAYTDRGLTIDGRTADGRYFDPGEDKSVPPAQPASNASTSFVMPAFPDSFRGIPYDRIIAAYWKHYGGEPAKGERNDKLFELAANLRAICDNQEDWLMAVMPRYGISDQEMRGIVHSACKEPTKGSRKIDAILEVLLTENNASKMEEAEADGNGSMFNINLRSLPIGLKESLIGVPENMYMPVLCAVLPIAAAYADQVEVKYCDGNNHRLGLMSIIQGDQASGKCVCKNAVDSWKRQFDEEDAIARKREEEWRERRKARKANEKAPDDPHVLIRMVPVTVSCSTLLRRLKNSNGHTLYSFCEELDTLRKTNGAGSWSSKYDIYRLSFDQGEWGQDYNSDAAESGVVNVAYNWTMLGTHGAMRKCFKADNIENGLSSRILMAEMPDSSFSKMPKFGHRTAEDEARIQDAVTRLRSCSGFIDTPRLRREIGKWVEEKRVEAAKDIDHVKDTYRKRSAVIGFRCGVVYHLLTGKEKETGSCLEFARMMAEYCLNEQISAFGEALMNQYVDAGSEGVRKTINHSIFDQLPPVFTADDLNAMKGNCISRNAIFKIISRWKIDGWIVKVDSNHWKKSLKNKVAKNDK